jgi:hypothetical protein
MHKPIPQYILVYFGIGRYTLLLPLATETSLKIIFRNVEIFKKESQITKFCEGKYWVFTDVLFVNKFWEHIKKNTDWW